MTITNQKARNGYRIHIKDSNTGDAYFGELTKQPGEKRQEAIKGFIAIMELTVKRYEESIKTLKKQLDE